MTIVPAVHGASHPHVNHPPRWVYQRVTPRVINEGDTVTFTVKCINPVPGAKIVLWMTGANLAGDGNWLQSWSTIVKAAVEAAGCAYLKLTSGTTPAKIGSVSWLITIGAEYADAQLMTFTNIVRKNRRNDSSVEGGIRGGAGAFQILLSTQSPTATFGSLAALQPSGGNFVDVRDTSRRPEETPTIRLRALSPGTNDPSPANLIEGEAFDLLIETANIIPGTRFKVYAANEAQKDTSPAFQTALKNAVAATPGLTADIPRWTQATALDWYRGGTITFGDDYDDAQPLRFTLIAKSELEAQPARTIDVIGQLTADGDLSEFDDTASKGDWSSGATYHQGDWVTYIVDGATYVYTEENSSSGHNPSDTTRWRPYIKTQTLGLAISVTIKDEPARFWELRATSDGATITYTIQGPTDHVGDAVLLTSTGAPAGFEGALTAAAHSGAPVSYTDGVLTALATDRADSAISFTVPHTGSGKHTLRLSESISGGAQTFPAWIVIGDACVYLTPPTLPADPAFVVGVNLSGGDFGDVYATGTTFGAYGAEYVYPSQPEMADPNKHREMDYHWGKGVRIIRVPFKWQRVQPVLFGPLYGDGGTGSWTGRQDMRRIDELVAYWTGLGGIAMLDCHNYMGYSFSASSSGKVKYDSTTIPIAALADLWERLADRYAGNPKIWFDLMNEPSGDGATTIGTAANMQAVVNAVRARTDFTGKLLCEGASYSSAARWVTGGQAAAFDDFHDPAGNFAFSPHCYLDADGSGTKGTCISGAPNRLTDITSWARSNGFKLFLGEVAGGNPATLGQEGCATVVPAVYDYMVANDDVWIGWTTWGGGRLWGGTYAFRLDPLNYATPVDSGAMQMLLPYLV